MAPSLCSRPLAAPATLTYETTGRIGRITLDRPERGNGITLEMPQELAAAVEEADRNPEVHVMCLSGRGKGFCGGYDLAAYAEERSRTTIRARSGTRSST